MNLSTLLLSTAALGTLAWALPAFADPPRYPGKEEARNVRLIGKHDLQARTAYQPTIKQQGARWIAYIGHHGGRKVNPATGKEEENGTTILDVTNPRAPKFLIHIPGERGREVPGRETGGAQMTRVCSGDVLPKGEKGKWYLLRTFGDSHQETYDVTSPEKPVLLAKFGKYQSTHKNDWECSTGIAYIPGSHEAYRASRVNNIWDLSDPKQPKFIRAFGLVDQLKDAKGYLPGQIHGSLSDVGANRVYIGYGTNRRGVAQIIDRKKLLEGPFEPTRENLLGPQVARIDLPEFMGAHTTFPLLGVDVGEFAKDKAGQKRDFLVVVNESNVTICGEHRQAVYFFDITDEQRPMGVATYDVREADGNFCGRGGRFGAHASHENTTPIFHKRLMFYSWFNAGVRIVDVRNPYRPREVGYYIPARNKNTDLRCDNEEKKTGCVPVVQINNMEVDDRGYIYAVDRADSGLFVLDLTGEARAIARMPR